MFQLPLWARGGGFRGTYRPTCLAASTLSLWVLRRGAWAPRIYKVYLVYRELCYFVQCTCPIVLLLISGLERCHLVFCIRVAFGVRVSPKAFLTNTVVSFILILSCPSRFLAKYKSLRNFIASLDLCWRDISGDLFFRERFELFFHIDMKKLKIQARNEIFRQTPLTLMLNDVNWTRKGYEYVLGLWNTPNLFCFVAPDQCVIISMAPVSACQPFRFNYH